MSQTGGDKSVDVDNYTLEEVVVTATRRSTSLQDTALSISAVTGETLDNLGLDNIRDFIATVPGVSLVDQGPGLSRLAIRGIATSVENVGNDTVAVYVNDFPVGGLLGAAADIQLVDMERVEVLKGPQGTLYGRDAMGGAIRYITRAPNLKEIEGAITGSYSDTDDGSSNFKGSGYLNLPLSDKIAVRGVFYANDNSGFIENIFTGEEDINGDDVIGGRIALKFDITENLSLDANYLYNKIEADGMRNVQPTLSGVPINEGFGQFRPIDQPYFLKNQQLSGTLNVSFKAFDLTLAASRSWFDQQRLRDVTLFVEPDYSNVSIDQDNISDFVNDTVELRAVSTSEGMFDWILGFWYENGDGEVADISRNDRDFLLFGALPVTADALLSDRFHTESKRNIAGYGELGVHFTENATLTLGYRHANVKSSENFTKADGLFDVLTGGTALLGANLGSNENVDTYKVHLEYVFNEDLLVYISAASGFRAGGFNDPTPVTPVTEYDSDTLWDYELGIRSILFDGRLTANAVVYRLDWDDMQLQSTDLVTGGSGIFNVGEAQIDGVELELTFLVTQELQLGLFYSMLDAELTKDYDPDGTGAIAFDGDRIPASAETSLAILVDWNKQLENGWSVFARGKYRYVGDQTTNFNSALSIANNEIEKLPSYEILDIRAGFIMPLAGNHSLKATVFAENITNEVAQLGFDNFFGTSIYINRPRTIGVELNYSF